MSTIPESIARFILSLNKKKPIKTVNIKLIAVAVGITTEYAPNDKALKSNNAEIKMIKNAKIMVGCNKKPTQSFTLIKLLLRR